MATTTRLKKLNLMHKLQVEGLRKDGYIETTKERGNRKYWLKAYECGVIAGILYEDEDIVAEKQRYYDTEREMLHCYNETIKACDKIFLNIQ